MCGIAGYIDLQSTDTVDQRALKQMMGAIAHRGPDDSGSYVSENVALGFRRLSIIDLEGGNQPLCNEDRSLVLVCNGEIFNYKELTRELKKQGHVFRTDCDVEVILHLYEEEGFDLLNRINGQFAFALYDSRRRLLFLARDHFGINPLYYAVAKGKFIFASEIKAILEHPGVERSVNLTGLDQVLSFPGLISPTTMFRDISSLQSGHYIVVRNGNVKLQEYWDLNYPREDEISYSRQADDYIENLREQLDRAVRQRLQADVPVGFYLSGGLDSSLIAAMIAELTPDMPRHSFSITFPDPAMTETQYQRLVAGQLRSIHHEIPFSWEDISGRLPKAVYHCESPLKETYNTCSLALSEAARETGVPVILTGEGADELFAGYIGYRFDRFRKKRPAENGDRATRERALRAQVWGDPDLLYETDLTDLTEAKIPLYSKQLRETFSEFDCLNFDIVNKERLKGRHILHQRSYLDVKLRLSDHLISEHGDRMALANAVEARYPFLDIGLAEYARVMPPDLKLNGFVDKYAVRRIASSLLSAQIVEREKFGFHAPGSPYLLQRNIEWINDLLSYERIRREGYFDPDAVEKLKAQYTAKDFRLNLPYETDLLAVVLTFGLLFDQFRLPPLN